ncbi:hypothetical protein [Microvirga yunnanensis]|uniref:hypothetical protein n=1 Tax=Microvirga yunnanensis TaxID=2953740 RepID=UPI0021C825B3|nr:hypothetical protein [Microvirga sp. HBU65207]
MARSTARSAPRKLHTTATHSHPDAALLRLVTEHAKAKARLEAAEIAAMAQPPKLSEAKFDRLCNQVSDIEDAILNQPAHSLDGIRAKALIAARYMQAPEDWGLRTYEVLGSFVQEVACMTVSRV